MNYVGTGKYTYEFFQDFPKLPAGMTFGNVVSGATDAQDRIYVFNQKNPPVVILDPDGNYLDAWGYGAIADPHGISIVDDIVYITDRRDSVAVIFTLDGKPLQVIGKRGVHSDTGCDAPELRESHQGVGLRPDRHNREPVPRAAGPFNHPTRMMPGPSGELYVSDGYRNSRVHRFTQDGQLLNSWGAPGKTAPGEFHLPHSVLVAPDGKVYVCDRFNQRVQIFSAEGEFISMWTGMGSPLDIARDKDGVFYILEQDGAHSVKATPHFVSLRDSAGTLLARWECRKAHGMWVNSRGDVFVGSAAHRSVDKYARRR